MAHSICLFLVSKQDAVDAASEKWEFWEDQVHDHADRVGDENNWYTILCGVTDEGETHLYDTAKGPSEGELKTLTWEIAMRLSIGIFQNSVLLSGTSLVFIPGMKTSKEEKLLDAMTRDELLAYILKEIPSQLAWQYMQMSGKMFVELTKWREDRSTIGSNDDWYTFKQRQTAFSALLESQVAPFTRQYDTSYYDYRCFDLRDNDGPDTKDCAIIYVDMHT